MAMKKIRPNMWLYDGYIISKRDFAFEVAQYKVYKALDSEVPVFTTTSLVRLRDFIKGKHSSKSKRNLPIWF